jgi:hypothetical protein
MSLRGEKMMFKKRCRRLIGPLGLAAVPLLVLAAIPGVVCAGNGEDIAAWENFLRYHPRDPRAEQTFRAIVRAASAPEHYDRNLKYADLVDIWEAQFNDQTGELILIGPRIRDQERGFLPPLLVVDDFVMALRVLDAVGDRNLGVSIGTYNRGGTAEEQEKDHRLHRQPVEYIPEMTAGRHIGFVLFEADRWLKGISHGKDNLTLDPLRVPIAGYQTQPQRAHEYFSQQAASGAAQTGRRPYGLNWFLPDPPQVLQDGYSMKFVSYRMTVQYKAETPDPEIAKFAEHMTENFEAYCKEFVVFQELVRLHKLVQVAKWYRASGFPDEELLGYEPLKIPTPNYTRRMSTLVGRFDVPGGQYEASLEGGVDFSPRNVYVSSSAVPARASQPGAPPSPQTLRVNESIAPVRYGAYRGPAPVADFVAPIIRARPTPTTSAWTVQINGQILRAIAIPATRKVITSGSSRPGMVGTRSVPDTFQL